MSHHHLRAAVAAIVAISLFHSRAAGYPWPLCGTSSDFQPNSTYQANLYRAAATLPKRASASPNLFATVVVGAIPEQLWAMGQCRGDTNGSTCFGCLTQAFKDLPNDCSYNKDATIYYDLCTLHYSDVHVLPSGGDDDAGATTDSYTINNNANVTSDPAQFNRLVAALINATADHAAFNSTRRRFATGEADFFDKDYPKVYTLAQCTPDQTPAQCRKCLAGVIASNLVEFKDRIGGRVLWFNCSWRYETAPFFNGPALVRLPSPSPAPAPVPALRPTVGPPTGGGRRKYSVPVVVLAVVLPTLAALNLTVCFCFWKRRRPIAQAQKPGGKDDPTYSSEAEGMEMVDSMMIDVSTLRAATGNFDDSNKLSDGAFGVVYKGVLPDGDEIAVKRLSKGSTQGVQELKHELALVAKLRHKNLVSLLGVCLEQQERLLVYEFVHNRNLDLILFDTENEKREMLDWEQRYKIINGIARGLQYLHEDSQLKVVHRDLKASNILLDKNMNPKIADFGLARIFGRDQTHAVTNTLVGTNGYMAPEYFARGNYSVRSDAFSFGVIVLEIVTGRRNLDWVQVWEHWEAGMVMELVDPSMGGRFHVADVMKCIHIGLLCVQHDPAVRPAMSWVVTVLGSDTVALQAPCKPEFFAKTYGAANMTMSMSTSVQG
ncbi:unnamed protein product [Urochloa humidicola]